ncbi:MAG: UDP-N-acetylmuramoylalanine--D-glutamate ligase [Vicingaceae bacterium]|nr:MAG: UDP-N-acetylmuramoylalanine--D-glutamate ligase [Vicingaceae bacterium]
MDKKIVILGSGESGVGAALLAKHSGYDVFVSDRGHIKDKYKKILLSNQIPFEENKHDIRIIKTADIVVKSPGIPNTAPIIQTIKENNIPLIGEIEFASQFFKGKIIAITGSNGKTTTTYLTYHILKTAGLNVIIGGNVGKSFSACVLENPGADWAVVETSSFQLEDIESFHPHIAVLLNITPDHLDRYDYDFMKYARAKWNITKNLTEKDYFIFNADDPVIQQLLTDTKPMASLLPFSIQNPQKPGGYLESEQLVIEINHKNQYSMSIYDLALAGKHNVYNSLAAALAAKAIDIKNKVIRESLHDFKGVEHRLEKVSTISGIEFINDSKATNVNSAWYALESMTKPVVWIAGGIDKGNDYSTLHDIVKQKVKALICLGVDNQKLIQSFKDIVPVIHEARSMEEAVKKAYYSAKKGDVVLLSPACASFDLFENYEHRGEQFKKAVREL